MKEWNRIEESIKKTIQTLHEELGWFTDEELENTPGRITKFYKEWNDNGEFKFTMFDNPGNDELVILKDITINSMCSHHMLPFSGKVHIGYLPGKKICGLSKLSRTAKKFASRPQVQENLTQEVADYLFEKLEARFVMIVVEAQHDCMRCRGVKEHNSLMITSAIKHNEFPNWQGLKQEFLQLISRK